MLDSDNLNSYDGNGTVWRDISGNNYDFNINASGFRTVGGIKHMDAEGSYGGPIRVNNNGENIGLASVYRVLTQFESAGMVKKHHFEGSHAVYEVIEENHEHMVDVESGKVLEFQDNELIER